MNLTTFRVWCYACEKEVFPEPRLAAHLPGSSHKFFEQVAGRSGVSSMGGDVLRVVSVEHGLVGPQRRLCLITVPR